MCAHCSYTERLFGVVGSFCLLLGLKQLQYGLTAEPGSVYQPLHLSKGEQQGDAQYNLPLFIIIDIEQQCKNKIPVDC